MTYRKFKRPKNFVQVITVIVILVSLLIGGGVYASRRYYFNNLKAVSNNQNAMTVDIPKGSSVVDVANLLKEKKLIRNEWAFKQYVLNHLLADKILAGTYSFSPSQNVSEIVTILTEGRIDSKLFTIKPGQRLDQIKQAFINAGYDTKLVDAAFIPTQYENHAALVDKPVGASLEGYLYPESFQKTANTTPQQIIRMSLDEMQKRLTPDVRAAISKQGLNVHQGITLASIINQEVSNPEDKSQVAQVFLKRYNMGMVLGSDVTAFYGSVIDGREPSVRYESPYNTHTHVGLPPGPISNVNQSSIEALVKPAQTDWLYFVAGDDGKTYFSKTNEEHEKLVDQHCKKLCNL